MNNLIDLFDVKTYPQEFINVLNKNDIEVSSYDLDEILNNFYIKCVHTTRVYDKFTLEQNGLLRPFVVDDNENEKYHINNRLKEFIFEPYNSVFSNKEIEDMKINYDNLLINEYIQNRKAPVDEYYGKFSVVHFTYDNISRVAVDDYNGYKNFLIYQGGELLDWKVSRLSEKNTKPYVIFFRIKIADLPNQVRVSLYDDMARVYSKKEFIVYPSGYVNKDIPSSDIIEVKEIDKL